MNAAQAPFAISFGAPETQISVLHTVGRRLIGLRTLLLMIVLLGLAITSPAATKPDRTESSVTAKEAEEAAARKYILDLPKQVRKWLTSVQHKPKPGEPWGLFTF